MTLNIKPIFFLLFCMLLLSFACSKEKEDYVLNYSILKKSKNYSLLKKINTAKKNSTPLIVCFIRSKNINYRPDAKMKDHFTNALNLWSSSLEGQKDWSSGPLDIQYMEVASFKSFEDETPDYKKCSTGSSMTVILSSGNEEFSEILNHLGYDNFDSPRSFVLQRASIMLMVSESYFINPIGLIIHELGHLIGLGDVYVNDFSDPITIESTAKLDLHPDAIMGSAMSKTESFTLYEDDKIGLRQVWNYVRTEDLACGNGYQVFNSDSDIRQSFALYCLPVNQGKDRLIEPIIHDMCPDGSRKNRDGTCELEIDFNNASWKSLCQKSGNAFSSYDSSHLSCN